MDKVPPEMGKLVHYNGHDTARIICNLCSHIFDDMKIHASSSGRTEYSIESKTRLVEAAAKDGCHLCNILLAAYSEPPEMNGPSGLSDTTISVRIWLDGLYRLAGDLFANYYSSQMSSDQTLGLGKKDSGLYGTTQLELELDLDQEPLNPMGLTAGDSTDSESTWACIMYWLDECTSEGTHKLCQHSQTSGRPRRLLSVSKLSEASSISVRLCENDEIPVNDRYVTLSHCWGTLEHIRLTKATLPSFKVEIPWDMLSRTFQDAASISCKLGVKWLWIDSLCIIQDSREDWNRESINMQSIYANSFCNISAADANDGTYGCFRDRSPLGIQPCRIILDGQTRYAMDTSSWERNIDKYNINKRAWVMQERLLSPRILYYTKNQVIWECNEGLASEALPYILPRQHDDARLFNRLIYKSPSDVMEQSKTSKEDIRRAWNLLILRYSRCQLTYESDKLMALDGLTSRIRELRGEADVFGLWPTDLELQLTWSVASGKLGDHRTRRLPPTIAPSWSWASIHGWGITPEYGDLRFDYKYRAVSHSQTLWHPGQRMTGTIVPNQHQGFLALRSMLLPANVETVPGLFPGMIHTQATPVGGRDSSTLYCYLDTDDDRTFIQASGKVWCAPLFSLVSKERDPQLEGLLLIQDTSQGTATFRRVGTFGNTIDIPPKGNPLRLPRPADLPVERSLLDFDFSDVPFKDKTSHKLDRPDTPSEEKSSIKFDTSEYDQLVKECLQNRFPGVDYPGANITINNGIEEHNIILC